MEHIILSATTQIERNSEAFDLLTGDNGTDDFSRAIMYDEFKKPRYFGGDMADFLKRLKVLIQNME
ncbi:hypothetical protein [Hymenobacter elongatus]|uniref:hypothetical protein n=1 Tax=Hymenobacter elongatus TaxID=877208 RepID=UPI001AEC49B2|nr:hypothetical protein [Hymenobacter elongatus]